MDEDERWEQFERDAARRGRATAQNGFLGIEIHFSARTALDASAFNRAIEILDGKHLAAKATAGTADGQVNMALIVSGKDMLKSLLDANIDGDAYYDDTPLYFLRLENIEVSSIRLHLVAPPADWLAHWKRDAVVLVEERVFRAMPRRRSQNATLRPHGFSGEPNP